MNRVTYTPQDFEPDEEFLSQAQPFTTREEIRDSMAKPEYKTNPFYRQTVERCLQLTDPALLNVGREEFEPTIPALEAKMEAAKRPFRDKRYKHDPLYRMEVAKQISQNSPNVAPEGKTNRIQFSTNSSELVSHEGLSSLRVEFPAQTTGFDKPERKPAQPKDNSTDTGAAD